MCLECERDDMLAAYQDYLAARRRSVAKPEAGAGAALAPVTPDWAVGTWFAAAAAAQAPSDPSE